MTNKRKYKRFRNDQKKDAREKPNSISRWEMEVALLFRKYASEMNELFKIASSLRNNF